MLQNLLYKKVNILLFSNLDKEINLILSLCQKINSYTCILTVYDEKQDIQNYNQGDIIIIGDNYEFTPTINNYLQTTTQPILLLTHGDPKTKPNQLNLKKITETLDIEKITSAGFDRLITNLLSNNQIIFALSSQKHDLEKLILNHEKRLTALANLSSLKQTDFLQLTRQLFEENHKLIQLLQKQMEELKKVSRHDSVTNTPNRTLFEEILRCFMANAKRYNHSMALLFIHIDTTNEKNVQYSEITNALLLKQSIDRVRTSLRKGDFIATISNNEFAVILPELKSINAAGIVAWKLLNELKKTFFIEKNVIDIDPSIGIACYPYVAETADELINKANIALNRAEKLPGSFQYATIQLQEPTEHRQTNLVTAFSDAVTNQEFEINYRPIFDLIKKRLYGFEAILTWNSAIFGNLTPEEFLPIAEETGLIDKINLFLVEKTCKDLAKFANFEYKITINVSSLLLNRDIKSKFSDIFNKYKISGKNFEFELSDISLFEDKNLFTSRQQEFNLETLSKKAFDVFHVNQAELLLKNLQRLPIRALKIDRTFIEGLSHNDSDSIIVDTIIDLAKKNNLQVIAEGVQTQEQIDYLTQHHCVLAQGDYFSKPIEAKNISNYLATLKEK